LKLAITRYDGAGSVDGAVVKKTRMSASSNQFTRFLKILADNAQRITQAAPRPKPAREAPEVRLIDSVEHVDDGRWRIFPPARRCPAAAAAQELTGPGPASARRSNAHAREAAPKPAHGQPRRVSRGTASTSRCWGYCNHVGWHEVLAARPQDRPRTRPGSTPFSPRSTVLARKEPLE
jgi:hypothetical protein